MLLNEKSRTLALYRLEEAIEQIEGAEKFYRAVEAFLKSIE